MICWVMYDIKNNRIRTKISKLCEKTGLLRVQFSVFLGKVEKNEMDTLVLMIKELIDTDEDSVYIFPMSKDELKATILLGQAFDKKYITDEINMLFI